MSNWRQSPRIGQDGFRCLRGVRKNDEGLREKLEMWRENGILGALLLWPPEGRIFRIGV